MRFSFKLIFCLLTLSVSSQEKIKSINCIIIVDELLIGSLTGEMEILNSGSISRIEFGYEYGEIRLTEDNYNKLQLLDENLMLTIKMKLNKMVNGIQKNYSYSKELQIIDLRQRYIIFRIYNCKKESCSRVYLETPRYHNPYPEPKGINKLDCKRYLAPR